MSALTDYGPFDAGTGANRSEDFWRAFFRHLTGDGVIDGELNEFAVSERAAGANMSVDVATGRCFIRGHWGELTTLANVAISAAHATLARIDRVVLRADFSLNTLSVEVLEGTPAASPSAPALTQSSSRWEISLAQISVPAADTAIGTAQITNERTIMGFPTFDYATAPTNGQTVVYDSTTGLWEPGSSGASVAVARAVRTAGDITLNSASWADTGVADLVIPAVAGDVIGVELNCQVNNQNVDTYFDVASIVAAAPVRYWSNDTGTPAGFGIQGWYCSGLTYEKLGSEVTKVVAAGDISGGNVTIRLRYKQASATARTLVAGASQPFHWRAVNYGQ